MIHLPKNLPIIGSKKEPDPTPAELIAQLSQIVSEVTSNHGECIAELQQRVDSQEAILQKVADILDIIIRSTGVQIEDESTDKG